MGTYEHRNIGTRGTCTRGHRNSGIQEQGHMGTYEHRNTGNMDTGRRVTILNQEGSEFVQHRFRQDCAERQFFRKEKFKHPNKFSCCVLSQTDDGVGE